MRCVSDEQLDEYLPFALGETDKPAMFVVFQNRPESISWLLNTIHQVTRSVGVLDVRGGDLESMLVSELKASRPPEIDIVSGAFSTIPKAARYTLNAGRDRLLNLGRKLVFVEPATEEVELRRNLPDIFSVVREVFHVTAPVHQHDAAPIYEHDDLFDTGGACRLATIASRLPPVVARDSAIIHGGKVHFKAQPSIPCPKCRQILVRGKTTIDFEYAPRASRRQIVDGWVCPCGESSYVPGSQARAAYLRAFNQEDGVGDTQRAALDERFALSPARVFGHPRAAVHDGGQRAEDQRISSFRKTLANARETCQRMGNPAGAPAPAPASSRPIGNQEVEMILVAGATGTVGREVVAQLLAAGERVRAMTRDPGRAKFDAKVEVVAANLDKPGTLEKALAGVDRVFALSTGPQIGVHDANLARAAKKAGARHLVKLSVLSVGEARNIIAQWHEAGEKAIQDSGLAWTFVRPGMFMSNALGWARTVKSQGKVFANYREGKVPPIHPRDIAAVAVAALTSGGHEGKSYRLTGGEALSMNEQVQILSEVVGRPIEFVPISDDAARDGMLEAGMPPLMVEALVEIAGSVRSGKASEVLPTVEQVLGRKPLTWADWARENAAAFR